MKKLHKILLFIVSLAGLLFSAAMLSLFYYIPVLTDTVTFIYHLFPLLHNAFAAYIVFVASCFLLLIFTALFSPKASNYLVVIKNGGKLQFSKQTVESTVRYSFADVDGISLSDVKAALGGTPEKTRIYVKLTLTDPTKLMELTETIKGKIESSLQSSLGITAKSINIRVVELAQDNKARKEESSEAEDVKDTEDTVTVSRVI